MTARLDPALHHPTRILIASRLVASARVRFTTLREACGLTSGNLASHLDALERAGYVEQRDAIIGLRPGKIVALTPAGREAFHRYVAELESVLEELKAAASRAP